MSFYDSTGMVATGSATADDLLSNRCATSVRPQPINWLSRYASALFVTDIMVIVTAVAIGQVVRFGPDSFLQPVGRLNTPSIVVMAVVASVWVVANAAGQCYDQRVLGVGNVEYARVIRAAFVAMGLIAILDVMINGWTARGFLAVSFVVGVPALVVSRWMWRQYLVATRKQRRNLRRVLVLGDLNSSTPLVERMNERPELGYEVIGLCVPDTNSVMYLRGDSRIADVGGIEVPILGAAEDVKDIVTLSGATVVAITSADVIGHDAIRRISWELEALDVEMLVAPAVVDVAGPRIAMRPEAGFPLLHIDSPRYRGANKFLKMAFDRTLASLLILAAAPVLVGCALGDIVKTCG
ncbi:MULTISPECIES: nucleoside-diphosphate sugar epimerase/dehydratase [unclassified Gordonia (in: high G+C Gram-positive bacteria)]